MSEETSSTGPDTAGLSLTGAIALVPRGPEDVDWEALTTQARIAMTKAYVPYSGYPVGAAALLDNGSVVSGCNVENASYGVGLCAECTMIGQLQMNGGGGSSPSPASTATASTSPPAGAAASCSTSSAQTSCSSVPPRAC